MSEPKDFVSDNAYDITITTFLISCTIYGAWYYFNRIDKNNVAQKNIAIGLIVILNLLNIIKVIRNLSINKRGLLFELSASLLAIVGLCGLIIIQHSGLSLF